MEEAVFVSQEGPLKIRDVLPMFHFLGFNDDEIALFLGMRPQSPYAEKYIANEEQELNHLQLFASRSMHKIIAKGLALMSKEAFIEWIKSPHSALENEKPFRLIQDVTKHQVLLDSLGLQL